MTRIVLVLLVVVAILGLGCAAPKAAPTPGGAVTARGGPTPTAAPVGAPGLELLPERMIVRTGDMTLMVEDVVKAMDEVARLAVEHGGYVISTSVQGGEAAKRGTISFRVPPQQFDSTILTLRDMAVRVMSETTSTQDVTQEYVDLESRLRSLEATEKQLLTFMQRAQTIDDILKVQRELNTVRGQIEQTKGRMQYLERTSAMSLVNVTLLATTSPEALVRPGWHGIEIVKSATRALVVFAQVLGTIGIWLGIFSPVWGAIVAIVWWRQRRARLKR